MFPSYFRLFQKSSLQVGLISKEGVLFEKLLFLPTYKSFLLGGQSQASGNSGPNDHPPHQKPEIFHDLHPGNYHPGSLFEYQLLGYLDMKIPGVHLQRFLEILE